MSHVMTNLYLIRYSEIGLKGPRARSIMERYLLDNIGSSLKNLGSARLFKSIGRFLLETDIPEEIITEKLKRIFGVRSFSPVVKDDFNSPDEIASRCLSLFGDSLTGKKFAIRCRRTGTHNFSSRDVERIVGSALYPYSSGVDLESPDIQINLEIREKSVFIYTVTHDGPGGLPLKSQAPMVSLMSGGIDSPVAAWYMMKRGSPVYPVFFSLAHPVDTLSFLRSSKKLFSEWSSGSVTKVFIIDGRPFLDLTVSGKIRFPNVTFKMLLYRVAEHISKRYGMHGIITGESMGQVSSQTAENLEALTASVRLPIYRPLIGFDKEEIVKIARNIGTFPEKDPGEFCSLFAARPILSITEKELLSEPIDDSFLDHLIDNATVITTDGIDSYMKNISSIDLSYNADLKNAIFVDMRARSDYEKGHFPGAVNVQLNRLPEFVQSLSRGDVVVFYCKKGLQSAYAASLLNEKGYSAFYSDEKIIK